MSASPHEQLVTVHLLQLPVRIAAKAQQWFEELLREFALIHAGAADGSVHAEVPGRLMALVETLVTRYSGLNDDARDRLEAAINRGDEVIEDHAMDMPPDAEGATHALGATMDEAERYCRQGRHLLTLAEPPDVLAYRRWYLDDISRQLRGGTPTPWPVYRARSLEEQQ